MFKILSSRFIWNGLVLVLVLGIIIGCNKQRVNLREMSPEQQFEYAKGLYDKKDYEKAKFQFTVILLNNPGHSIIEDAQFYLAESYFGLGEYVLAIEEYEKLIRSMPQSEFVDDARYKVGYSYYKLSPGYALDQEYTRKAISQFQLFLEENPQSELKEKVEEKLLECRSKLAKKEFKAGEQYRKMSYYKAAVIYFGAVVEKYYDTEFVVEAIFWKGECHKRMGEWDEAEAAFKRVREKFPQSPWAMKIEDKLKEIQGKKALESKETVEE